MWKGKNPRKSQGQGGRRGGNEGWRANQGVGGERETNGGGNDEEGTHQTMLQVVVSRLVFASSSIHNTLRALC